MAGNTISLGEVAERTEMLGMTCNRCDRRGRLRIARLAAEHGPSMPMPTLLHLLTADCPQHGAMGVTDQCGAYFPDLPALFGVARS
jgi:hypothetical protein